MYPVISLGPDSHILWLKAILPISSTSAPSAQYSQVQPTRARTVTIWDDPVQWYVQLSHFYHRNKTNWNPTKCNWNPIESNPKIKQVELNPRWEITWLHASRAAFVWLQQEHDSRKLRFVYVFWQTQTVVILRRYRRVPQTFKNCSETAFLFCKVRFTNRTSASILGLSFNNC